MLKNSNFYFLYVATNSKHYAEFNTLYGKETSDQYQLLKIETHSNSDLVFT